MLIDEPLRLLGAAGLVLLYAALCRRAWRQAQRGRRASLATVTGWTIVHASQTGSAEALAREAAQALARTGEVDCLSLNQLTPARLQAGGRFLFVASTSGEGQAPDNGSRFAREALGQPLDLTAVTFALLALGDRDYPQFCAFGHRLDAWLAGCGARAAFQRIDVDRLSPHALAGWRQHLLALSGAEDWETAAPAIASRWQVLARHHLNPGSPGGEVHHLRLKPEGDLPLWEAGDLAMLLPDDMDGSERAYSIASCHDEGTLDLLVRRTVRPDGEAGAVSGWLTRLQTGQSLGLSIRPHRAFRQQENLHRPALLIGNGVGLGGLRAHLAARIRQGNQQNWLVFGERTAQHDFYWREQLEAWQAAGALARLDTVFSRDGGEHRHVQDRLRAVQSRWCNWVACGAAIYVCGSRPMAESVDRLLIEMLGLSRRDELALSGRYVRDVF